jgi:hypothetical protein
MADMMRDNNSLQGDSFKNAKIKILILNKFLFFPLDNNELIDWIRGIKLYFHWSNEDTLKRREMIGQSKRIKHRK